MEEKDVRKSINRIVNRCNNTIFIDRDTDNYIYASLTQPPLKILSKNNSKDEMDYTVECPNCGNAVNYGREIYMLSGYHYCDNHNCLESLRKKLKI